MEPKQQQEIGDSQSNWVNGAKTTTGNSALIKRREQLRLRL